MTKTSIVYGGILRGWHRLILKIEGGPGRLQPVPPSHGEIEDYGKEKGTQLIVSWVLGEYRGWHWLLATSVRSTRGNR